MNNRIIGFPPLMCNEPRILILGSLPGVESLEHNEYYYSNSNRMWRVLSALNNGQELWSYEQKKQLLSKLHIILWDYYQSALREGSSDKKLKDGIPNYIISFLKENPTIETIAINGFGKYKKFGRKIQREIDLYLPDRHIRVLKLPETSGLNVGGEWGVFENLVNEWRKIL